MQIYIIGIGQCGTSVAFDVISDLTGFVKSKDVKSSPERGGDVAAARNELLNRLNKDLTRTQIWRARIGSWLSRLWNGQKDRKAFIPPQIAIVDGNPDNFVKDAFEAFSGNLVVDETERPTDLRQLVDLITSTKVFGLGAWATGCANGLVGEAVTTANLQPDALRQNLGVDGLGNLNDPNLIFPVSVFLVVSSGGGSTGSGGGVYLAKSDALLPRAAAGAQAGPPSHAIVANAMVLPSIEASSDNRKYALNAGRALARHGGMITGAQGAEGKSERPSATILFSNPQDEGDSRALQRLNNYLAEFAVRVANFTFPGNVARIARDVDTRELRFLSGKTCVLAMGHLAQDLWYEEDLESKLVERAFANIYEDNGDKPHGLSVEDLSRSKENGGAGVLSTASNAMVAIGVPPTFEQPLSIAKIGSHLRKHSGSPLRSGIRTFAYGAGKNLELTVFLRYRNMGACPLAMHFVRQYVGQNWNANADSMLETEYVVSRAEQDDDYAETFEEIAADLDQLGGTVHFGGHMLRRPPEQRVDAPPPAADV